MSLKLKKKQHVDPVCGMKVDSTDSTAKTTFSGTRIYFCAESCKQLFDADPKKFMSNRPKSFWNRYLDRLNKATGGRPPSCCS